MDDSVPEVGERSSGEEFPEEDADRLAGIIRDGVVGLVSGLVGMALMTVVLMVGRTWGAFSWEAFVPLARLFGLDVAYPAVAVGYAIFTFQGLVTWPLLFAALKGYLPWRTDPAKGVIFGTVLWTGFAPGFLREADPASLAVYLGFTLVAHWAYGFGMGVVFEYLTTRPESLV